MEAVRVSESGEQAVEHQGYDLLRTAREMGDEILISVLSPGAITNLTVYINPQEMDKALTERLTGPRLEQNLAAYRRGLQIAAETDRI